MESNYTLSACDRYHGVVSVDINNNSKLVPLVVGGRCQISRSFESHKLTRNFTQRSKGTRLVLPDLEIDVIVVRREHVVAEIPGAPDGFRESLIDVPSQFISTVLVDCTIEGYP